MKYNDYKAKVSIMMVAHDLGYIWDRKEGRSQPHFVRKDTHGNVIDDINIKNPNVYENQGYWRRHPAPGQLATGDLISFIKENKREFDEYAIARNDIDLVNRVLARYARVPMTIADAFRGAMGVDEYSKKTFRIEDWDRTLGFSNTGLAIMRERGFSRETSELFARHVEMVRNKNSTNRFVNLAFPYTVPGRDEIKGYEIRGFGSFKSKAEGTDSEIGGACWCVYLGNRTEGWQKMVSQIHMAESAFDVMAFTEMNRDKLDLGKCVFVSLGGQFANKPLLKLKEAFPNAGMSLHFDNDTAGRTMTCKAIALFNDKTLKVTPEEGRTVYNLDEKVFSLEDGENTVENFVKKSSLDMSSIEVWGAPGNNKDWNDALKAQKGENMDRKVANAERHQQMKEKEKHKQFKR